MFPLQGVILAQKTPFTERVTLLEAPSSYPVAHRGLRRIVLERFPYLVSFRERAQLPYEFAVSNIEAWNCPEKADLTSQATEDGPRP